MIILCVVDVQFKTSVRQQTCNQSKCVSGTDNGSRSRQAQESIKEPHIQSADHKTSQDGGG